MSTILPVWGAALLVSLSCWGVGAALVKAKSPAVALLAGWCVFLVLCTVPWIAGLAADTVRPLFWIFFAAGLTAVIRGRRWADAAAVTVGAGLIAFVLCYRCYAYGGAMAFGAHGTDMWGYVSATEWLYGHGTRDLPDIGNSPMRFNWTWYVLTTRERPLVYEALACLGSSTGLSPLKVYMAWPVALMASLAVAVARTPGVFGLKRWWLALLPAAVMAFHPLIVLHWIAGFAASTVVGLLVALAFAALVSAEDEGAARTEAVALVLLLTVLCGGLYSPQFMLIGVGIAGVLTMVGAVVLLWRRRGWRELVSERPGALTGGTVVVAAALMGFTMRLSGDKFIASSGFAWSREVLGQLLGIFGGNSPYAWLYYREMEPWDQQPLLNPVGLAALAVMAGLFVVAGWKLLRAGGDLRIPLVVGICVSGLLRVGGDERAVMAKAMPIFGFALVVLVAAISARLRPRWLGLVALVVCCMPAVRSRAELREMIRDPYITCTEENMRKLSDGENWRIMAYLYFEEDREGYDWSKNPRIFGSMTCFLPDPVQVRLAKKYHMAKP